MIEWVKEHPYLSGGIVLGAVILFFLLRGSGSGGARSAPASAGGPSEALQAAQLQASTQLQMSQNAGTAQTNLVNAQVAATQIKVGLCRSCILTHLKLR